MLLWTVPQEHAKGAPTFSHERCKKQQAANGHLQCFQLLGMLVGKSIDHPFHFSFTDLLHTSENRDWELRKEQKKCRQMHTVATHPFPNGCSSFQFINQMFSTVHGFSAMGAGNCQCNTGFAYRTFSQNVNSSNLLNGCAFQTDIFAKLAQFLFSHGNVAFMFQTQHALALEIVSCNSNKGRNSTTATSRDGGQPQ